MANSDGQGGSAYPKSVQAGIPRLEVPDGWTAPKIGKLFKVVKRPVDLIDDEEYQLVTARRNRGGIVARGRLRGKDILTKSQFRVAKGDFLISRRQIAHGACGIVPAELDGAIVSNEYAVLRPTDLLDSNFLRHLPHSVYFQQTCFHSSIGVHVEKLVFKIEDWWKWKIAIPRAEEQAKLAEILDDHYASARGLEKLHRLKSAMRVQLANDLIQGDEETTALNKLAHINRHSLPESTSDEYRFEYFPIGGEDDADAGGWMTFAESPSRARRLARPGDIIYSTVRPLLRRIFRAPMHDHAVYSTGYAIIEPKQASNGSFIFHAMTTATVERQVHGRLTGSGYPAISARDLATVSLPRQSQNQREMIGNRLDFLLAEEEILGRLAKQTQLQSQELRKRLLSGALAGASARGPAARGDNTDRMEVVQV